MGDTEEARSRERVEKTIAASSERESVLMSFTVSASQSINSILNCVWSSCIRGLLNKLSPPLDDAVVGVMGANLRVARSVVAGRKRRKLYGWVLSVRSIQPGCCGTSPSC